MSRLSDYYGRRADDYEEIYHRDDPVRQREQAEAAAAMRQVLADRSVLEVACGTGFWTEIAAEVTQHIVALDMSPEMLALAQEKEFPPGKVEFLNADAYALETVPGRFDAGLANFWFSHVPKARVKEFLDGFHKRLGPGAVVFMADNVYVPGVGGKLITRPGIEDTFKLRKLPEGSEHEVLKNYYSADQLRSILSPLASELQVHVGKCFWWVSYTVI